jgi:H+/gluconate symporter-like permease
VRKEIYADKYTIRFHDNTKGPIIITITQSSYLKFQSDIGFHFAFITIIIIIFHYIIYIEKQQANTNSKCYASELCTTYTQRRRNEPQPEFEEIERNAAVPVLLSYIFIFMFTIVAAYKRNRWVLSFFSRCGKYT